MTSKVFSNFLDFSNSQKQFDYFNSRAQGTIEYLVIIAIVIVISLVVVGLMLGQTENVSSVSSNSAQIGLKTGTIGVSEAVAGQDANALIVLQNNSGASFSVNKVIIDGVDHVFGSEPNVGMGEKISLDLNGIIPCSGTAKKNYSVKIIYTASSGLEKTFDLGSIALDCVEKVNPNGTFVSEGADTNESGRGENKYTCTNATPFENGAGTLASPYGICNWTQLNNARDNLDANFILLNNLDSSSAGYAGLGDDWNPIGDCGEEGLCYSNPEDNHPFIGSFDGNDFTISDLIITKENVAGVGLFAIISGSVKNVGLIDINISDIGVVYGTVEYPIAGGLVGWNNYGTIDNCYTTGTILVTGDNFQGVGGLVGASDYGTISNSYSTAAISVNTTEYVYYVGGLAGWTEYTDSEGITDSYSTGNLEITTTANESGSGYIYYVGGLTGYNYENSISNSYSTSDIIINNDYYSNDIGGLAGYHEIGTITNSYATGNINGTEQIAGLVGYFGSGTITNSYSTGDINGSGQIAGLVGYFGFGTISKSYSNSTVNGNEYVGGLIAVNNGGSISDSFSTGAVTGSGNYTGGLVGFDSGSVSNSYAIGVVNGNEYVGGLMGYLSSGSVSNSFSTSAVTGSGDNSGGLIGINYSAVSDSYFDTVLSSQSYCYYGGNDGCTSTEDAESYYYDSSNPPLSSWTWDEDGWTQRDGNYPVLTWQTQ